MALTDNLRAYYKLDNVNDSSGNGYTLTNLNSTPFVSALIGNGSQHNGSTGGSRRVLTRSGTGTTGSCGIDGSMSYTHSFWFYLESPIAISFQYCTAIECKHNNSNDLRNYFSNLYLFGGVIGYGMYNGSTYRRRPYPFTTSTWYHFVFVADKDGNSVKTYINGVEEFSGTFGSGASGVNRDSSFTIGGAGWDGGNTFIGKIDESGLWNRALSVEEVSSLYNGGAGLTYPFTPTLLSPSVSDAITVSEYVDKVVKIRPPVFDSITVSEDTTIRIPILFLSASDSINVSEKVSALPFYFVKVLVIGGGGGGTGGVGGSYYGSAGAGGCARYDSDYGLIANGHYSVTLGGGGNGVITGTSGSGQSSVFETITAAGGSGIAHNQRTGGGNGDYNGGTGSSGYDGGGGAGAAGNGSGPNGGAAYTTTIIGSSEGYGGGGGGGAAGTPGTGGTGGSGGEADDCAANTGGGGGGGSAVYGGGNGGSGIVILAFATSDFSGFSYSGSYTSGTNGSETWVKMTSSGSLLLGDDPSFSSSDSLTVSEDVTVTIPTLFLSSSEEITVSEYIANILKLRPPVLDLIAVSEEVTIEIPILPFFVFEDALLEDELVTVNIPILFISVFEENIILTDELVVLLPTLWIEVSEDISIVEVLDYDPDIVFVLEFVSMSVLVEFAVQDSIIVEEDIVQVIPILFVDLYESVVVSETSSVFLPVYYVFLNEAVSIGEENILNVRFDHSLGEDISVEDIGVVSIPTIFIEVFDDIFIDDTSGSLVGSLIIVVSPGIENGGLVWGPKLIG